jgi:hypothetical protein
MKLNRWQRIGVLASVIWALSAGIHRKRAVDDAAIRGSGIFMRLCLEDTPAPQTANGDCIEQTNYFIADVRHSATINAIEIAFLPLLLGWGVVYLAIFLYRRVKRSSTSPSASQ